MGNALKIASSVVGLLAGVVAGVYVLGGLVIALRLLFDSFSLNEIVAILGQLPRELVISTAMLDVLLPAATVGLVVGLVAAVWADLRGIHLRPAGEGVGIGGGLLLLLAALVLMAPALYHAWRTEGPTLSALSAVLGLLVTLLAAYAGWYGLRKVAHTPWEPGLKLLTAGVLVAAVAVVPALMFASSLAFPHAQVCVSDSPVAVRGLLVGEGGGRVLLEQHQASEAGIIALPSDHVGKTEYGDLTSGFVCPLPGGQAPAKVAEAALEAHGSARERLLAMKVRPRLLFDSQEHWRPLEVERFVSEQFPDREGHKACWDQPAGRCEPVGGLSQLRPGGAAPDYLDIHGEEENGVDFSSPNRFCHTSSPPARDCNAGAQTAIYYRRTTHEGRWYWDYWWFFRYNDYAGSFNHCNPIFCGDHEGDWEGVTVVTTPSLTPEITEVIYAAHKNRILVEGTEAPLEGGHPLVFVAEGTHASYPYRCSAGCRQYAAVEPFGRLSEDPHDGAVSWGGNEDGDCVKYRCVRPLPEVGQPSDLALPRAGRWAGWPGQWGRTCHEGCESFPHLLQASPRSPGTQIRFKCPWAATDRALPGPGTSGLSRSEPLGDTERQLAACAAQRGGL